MNAKRINNPSSPPLNLRGGNSPLKIRGAVGVMKPKLIIITGPTASGKTALSLKLAKKFRGEIISADSRQVYRGMDIGTAKVPISPARRSRVAAKSSIPSNDGIQVPVISSGIPHYLINIRNPYQSYTLAQFQRDAIKIIKQIHQRGRIPFLVGGTGLYLNALINNLQIPEVKPNPKLRKKLEKLPVARLFKILNKKDPARAKNIDQKNKRRLIRALEIVAALGHVPLFPFPPPAGVWLREGGIGSFLTLGIKKSNPALRRSINHRVEQMFKAGLVQEVKKLTKKYGRCRPAFDAIGYREIIDCFNGKLTVEQAQNLIRSNTWRFTRRQMSWFRRLPIVWIKNQAQAEAKVRAFLAKTY